MELEAIILSLCLSPNFMKYFHDYNLLSAEVTLVVVFDIFSHEVREWMESKSYSWVSNDV